MPCASRALPSAGASRLTASASRAALERLVRPRLVEVELPVRCAVRGQAVTGVALQQVTDPVAGLGRVEEVGGDRRVHRQRAQVRAERVEAPQQLLRLMRPDGATAGQRGPDRLLADQRGVEPEHLCRLAVEHDGQAEQGAAGGGARPGHAEVEHRGAGEAGESVVEPVRPYDLRLEDLAARDHRDAAVLPAQRLVQAVHQGAELEELEEPLHLGHPRLEGHRVEVDLDRDVPAQDHDAMRSPAPAPHARRATP